MRVCVVVYLVVKNWLFRAFSHFPLFSTRVKKKVFFSFFSGFSSFYEK